MIRHLSRPLALIALFSGVLMVFLLLLACGCSDDRGGYYQRTPRREKRRPYPSAQVERTRGFIETGDSLYAQAIDAPTQEEKNRLAKEALDSYYRPAQDIVDRLREDYPEHESSFDTLGQELNRKIYDANRLIGTGY